MEEFYIEHIGLNCFALFNLHGFIVGTYETYEQAYTAMLYEFAA